MGKQETEVKALAEPQAAVMQTLPGVMAILLIALPRVPVGVEVDQFLVAAVPRLILQLLPVTRLRHLALVVVVPVPVELAALGVVVVRAATLKN